ncbi:hypothetical protein KW429_11905 [Vibrio fluvialis]|nr:hypothetical protein [Vibrio fluvialis]
MISIQFVGIDSFNRPIFKSLTDNAFYGSTEKLFSLHASESEVLAKVSVSDLDYFGSSFGCEPMGTPPARMLQIVSSS